jgi:hypothetical protein
VDGPGRAFARLMSLIFKSRVNILTALLIIVLLTFAFGWSSYNCLPPDDREDC